MKFLKIQLLKLDEPNKTETWNKGISACLYSPNPLLDVEWAEEIFKQFLTTGVVMKTEVVDIKSSFQIQWPQA